MEVVGGSIPLATTNFLTATRALSPTDCEAQSGDLVAMLKFLGSTIGIIFLIGLVVTILLLKFIF